MYTEYQIMLPKDLSSSRGSRPRHSTSTPWMEGWTDGWRGGRTGGRTDG
jgi:hypothetical protein